MSVVVMEEQSQPVFRDFLGPAAPNSNDFKQPELSATDSVRVSQTSGFMEVEDGEASVRGGSTFSGPCPSAVPAAGSNFPASSDPGTEMWRHSRPAEPFNPCMNDDGRKREERGSSFRENLLHESQEGSRPMKVSRFKQNDGLPTGAGSGTGDLGLSMQPPRVSQSGMNAPWFQSSVFKADPSTGSSKRLESSRPGVPLPRSNPVGSAAATFPRNSPGAAVMQPPPADEGSRTGLQGGGIAALINNNAAVAAGAGAGPAAKLAASARAGPVADAPALDRSASGDRFKLPLQTAGSDPLLPPSSHKASTSVTRQLTIFYGGQAHVFDDVSPDKAEAIMNLAGSNGRSWSTTYAHRSSRSEGSLGDLDRRRDKVVNGSSQIGMSPDMQNILQGLNNQAAAGQPRKHRFPAEQMQQCPLPWSSKLPSGKLPRPCDS